MTINFIKNENDAVKSKIIELLSKKSLYKLLVLGTIDDYVFESFNCEEISSDFSQFISIDKKYTTYKMLERLAETSNTYVYNNNLHNNTKKENIIFCEYENEIEVLISSFEFTKDNFDNSASFVIYIKAEKDSTEATDILSLYNYYKNNEENYLKLSKEILNNFEKNKDFRNSKINTIFKEMEIDEVISSFRNKENAYKNIYKEEKKLPLNDDIDIEINID